MFFFFVFFYCLEKVFNWWIPWCELVQHPFMCCFNRKDWLAESRCSEWDDADSSCNLSFIDETNICTLDQAFPAVSYICTQQIRGYVSEVFCFTASWCQKWRIRFIFDFRVIFSLVVLQPTRGSLVGHWGGEFKSACNWWRRGSLNCREFQVDLFVSCPNFNFEMKTLLQHRFVFYLTRIPHFSSRLHSHTHTHASVSRVYVLLNTDTRLV